jgi:hypothetical protein
MPKPTRPATATIPATGRATVVVVVNPKTPRNPGTGEVITATVTEPVPVIAAALVIAPTALKEFIITIPSTTGESI